MRTYKITSDALGNVSVGGPGIGVRIVPLAASYNSEQVAATYPYALSIDGSAVKDVVGDSGIHLLPWRTLCTIATNVASQPFFVVVYESLEDLLATPGNLTDKRGRLIVTSGINQSTTSAHASLASNVAVNGPTPQAVYVGYNLHADIVYSVSAACTVTVQYDVDGTGNWYNGESTSLAGAGNGIFHVVTAALYVRLSTSALVTMTAGVALKD